MIISHKYKFIFVKTKKTAGTSVEIALSRHLGSDDIITPISPNDEDMRIELGGMGPQHFIETSLWNYSPRDWVRRWRRGKIKERFFNHIPAKLIRRRIGEDVWNSYQKFTIERNPWDKVVSLYHYQKMDAKDVSLEQFIKSGKSQIACDYDRYSIGGVNQMDFICRYENLQADLNEICGKIGIPELELPRAKGGFRTEKRPYSELYTSLARDIVAKDFKREIELFGYEF